MEPTSSISDYQVEKGMTDRGIKFKESIYSKMGLKGHTRLPMDVRWKLPEIHHERTKPDYNSPLKGSHGQTLLVLK